MSTAPNAPKPPPEPAPALAARIDEHNRETMRLVSAQRHRCAALEAECDEAQLAASRARKARDKGVNELYRIIDERENGLREVKRGQQVLPFAGTLPETPPQDPVTIRAALGLVERAAVAEARRETSPAAAVDGEGDAAARLVAKTRAARDKPATADVAPTEEDPWVAPVSRLALLGSDVGLLRAAGLDTIAQLATFTDAETLSEAADCSEAAARRMLGALARYRELHPDSAPPPEPLTAAAADSPPQPPGPSARGRTMAALPPNLRSLMDDPDVNDFGIYAHAEELEAPLSKASGARATIRIAKGNDGKWRYGTHIEALDSTQAGSNSAPSVNCKPFPTRLDAILACCDYYLEWLRGRHKEKAIAALEKWRRDMASLAPPAPKLEPAIAAAKVELDSLKALPPELKADVGDWSTLPVEDLGLSDDQVAVLDRLGIHTAGQLDDLVEGRGPARPTGRPLPPAHGTASPELAEAFRAPFHRALSKVKSSAAVPHWHRLPIEDLSLSEELVTKASAAGIVTAGQLDAWIDSDASNALTTEEIVRYDRALRDVQKAAPIKPAPPDPFAIITVDAFQWIWKGLREHAYLGAIPVWAVLSPKQTTPVYALIAVDAADAAAHVKAGHPPGTKLTTVPLTRELAKGRPGVHRTPAAQAVLAPKPKAHAKGNGKPAPESKPAPIGTLFSVRRHGSTKPYYYVRAFSLRDVTDYVHRDMPNANIKRIAIQQVEESAMVVGVDVRDLTTGTDPLGVHKPAPKGAKSPGARP